MVALRNGALRNGVAQNGVAQNGELRASSRFRLAFPRTFAGDWFLAGLGAGVDDREGTEIEKVSQNLFVSGRDWALG